LAILGQFISTHLELSMTHQLFIRLSSWLTPNRLQWIRLGLIGIALAATGLQSHIAWAGDLGGGGGVGGG
jgi:hypothetical protein